MLKFNARGNFSDLIRRRMKSKFIRTIFYRESDGMMYHLHEVGTRKSYANCIYMETFESDRLLESPAYWVNNMFNGCLNLKSVTLTNPGKFGHYLFTGTPSLEYVCVGSIGHPYISGGYFQNTSTWYNSRAVGSPVGLRVDLYVDEESFTYWDKPWANSTVAADTKIYYYSSNTGEYLRGVNVDE